MDEERELFSNNKSSASGCCLAFCLIFPQFQPGVAYKSVAHKKACNLKKLFLQCQKSVSESVLTKRVSIFNKVVVLESTNLRNSS